MEISGICNPYDYLMQCKVIRRVVRCCCKGIILEFCEMMGMRAFGWFRMVVLFYGAFFVMTGFKCT